MKRMFIMTVVLAFLMAACSKDNQPPDGAPEPVDGEKSVVTLTIYDATLSGKSRAAGNDTDPPIPAESTVDHTKGINVVVFNENGSLAYPLNSQPFNLGLREVVPGTPGKYISDPFEITSGWKYFYVFVNNDKGLITPPSVGMTRDQFIGRKIASTLDGSDKLNITDPNFLIGTLWSEKKAAPAGGTAATPAKVSLTIGRLASKVTLYDIAKGNNSDMAGVFSDPKYRLGTIPKVIFGVGNNDETVNIVPPLAGHGIVKSAVHTEDAVDSSQVPNPVYQAYTSGWKNIDPVNEEFFYTSENTTAPDQNGIQYYGNTTYIQIQTLYTPDDSEVYDPTDLTPITGTFAGPTFYTANVDNIGLMIFEDDPRVGTPHTDIDQGSVLVYTNGLNYHKFAIYDKEAGLPQVQRHTVLRNHSYRYKVTNILKLGSNEANVDPEEPIETPTTLELEVEIAPWSKIEDEDISI